MKKLNLACLMFFLVTSNLMYAQEEKSQNGVRVGVGVTLSDIKELLVMLAGGEGEIPNFYIPIDLSPSVRITPEIGYFQSTQEHNTEYKSDYLSEKCEYETKTSVYQIGLGIFKKMSKKNIDLYSGIRGGFIHSAVKNKGNSTYVHDYYGYQDTEIERYDNKETTSGFYIGPTIGGEYFLSNHFSLGAEVQVKYYSTNTKEEDNENSDDGDDKDELSVSSISTKPLVFVRFYF